MTQDVLEKPILVIGAGRSGTRLLSRILASHPDVAYIDEPSYTWRRGNGRLPHEMFPAGAARPEVVARIRASFRRICEERGRRRIAEKTPANCLRLPFVLEVLPDARILHLVRDGRDVAVSARKKFEGNPDKVTRLSVAPATPSTPAPRTAASGRLARLRRGADMALRKVRTDPPGLDLVYYLPSLVEQQLAWLGLRRSSVWGPRIPGLRQLLRTHSTLEVAAIQWRVCVEQVLNFTASRSEVPTLFVRYEDLCREPRANAERIFAFCELQAPATLDDTLAQIIPVRGRSWADELDAAEIAAVHCQTADTLRRLGYEV